jgi:hypothetical protein
VSEPPDLSSGQTARHAARCADQDRALTAILDIEAARIGCTRSGTRTARGRARSLGAPRRAHRDEYTNAEKPDSLLADVKRTQPRLRTRVRSLRAHYQQLRQALISIRAELTRFGTAGPRLPRHPPTPRMDPDGAARPARPRVRPDLRGVLRRVPRRPEHRTKSLTVGAEVVTNGGLSQ